VTRNPPQNVIVHNDSEDDQEEDQPNLHKALFEAQTQIAPHDSFNPQQQDISAIQYGDRLKI
jgi:hypothetical protein